MSTGVIAARRPSAGSEEAPHASSGALCWRESAQCERESSDSSRKAERSIFSGQRETTRRRGRRTDVKGKCGEERASNSSTIRRSDCEEEHFMY